MLPQSSSPLPLLHTSYVGGNQNRQILLLEIGDDLVSLTLVHVSVQEAQAVALLLQVSCQFLTVRLLGDKNEDRARGGELDQPPDQPRPFF